LSPSIAIILHSNVGSLSKKENSHCTIIKKKNDTFQLGLTNGEVTASLRFNHDKDLKITDTGLLLPTMQWIHVALIYSGSLQQVLLYINGNKEYEITTDCSELHSNTGEGIMHIGYSTQDKPFSGIIRDVRIWTSALSTEDLYNSMLSSTVTINSSLFAYWPLDLGEGYIATNKSLNKSHGYIYKCQWILEGTNQISSIAHRKEHKKKRVHNPSRPTNEPDPHQLPTNLQTTQNHPSTPTNSIGHTNWLYPAVPAPYPYVYVPQYGQPPYPYFNPYYLYQTPYYQ